MPSELCDQKRSVPALCATLCALALLLLPAAVPAQTEDPTGVAAEGAAAEAPGEVAGKGVASETKEAAAEEPGELQPPDGVWLKDEDGREYFVRELPKTEKWYWTSPAKTHIRYRGFEYYEVERQDDDSFYVRVYRPTGETLKARQEMSPEEKARIEASYRTDTGEVDRFELAFFGEGLPQKGQWRNGFDIADMNGDGHPDIVHGPSRKGTFRPVIFLGDGEGGWSFWDATTFPPIPFVYGDAGAADLNGDGHADMVLAMHLQGLVALLGDGEGGFRDWSEGLDFWRRERGGDPGFSSRTVETVDWNGDGRPDILALGEGPRPKGRSGASSPDLASSAFGIALYLNQGDGSWEKVLRGAEGQLFGDALALGDFDGDGRTDFATASATRGLRGIVHLGREDGSWRTVELEEVRPRAVVPAVAVHDFDADGRDDLALTYSSYEGVRRTGIDVLMSRQGGEWQRVPVHVEEGKRALYALDVGDLDGNGLPELIALDDDGGTLIFSYDGDGGWARELTPELVSAGTGCRGYHVRAADLDGDGSDELVEEFAGEPDSMFAPDHCSSRGALRAWKATERAAPPAP